MASRHRRLWTEWDTERFIDLVLKGHRDVVALLGRAPVSSPVYRELSAINDALHKAAIFLGHDWAHSNFVKAPPRRQLGPEPLEEGEEEPPP